MFWRLTFIAKRAVQNRMCVRVWVDESVSFVVIMALLFSNDSFQEMPALSYISSHTESITMQYASCSMATEWYLSRLVPRGAAKVVLLSVSPCLDTMDPSHNSHNASFCNRNVLTCAHCCYEMVHYGIWDSCIVRFVQEIYCGVLIVTPCRACADVIFIIVLQTIKYIG